MTGNDTKTTQVASDRASDQSITVMPSEVAQGVYMEHAPSLRALKLFNAMVSSAGGRMADDVKHTIRLSEINNIDGMFRHDRSSITPLFGELSAATLIHDDKDKMRVTIGGLLDQAQIDYSDEAGGDLLISWYFRRTFRDMARDSNHWALLDKQAIYHLGSKYSVLLFQHISSLIKLKYVNSRRFKVSELRAILGVPEGKLARFANLKKDALEHAITEINSDITRLHLTATYHKVGRTVSEVEIAWEVDEDPAKVKAEQDRHSTGRKARQNGTAETPVLVFPSSGKIDGKWEIIARDNAPRLQGNHVPNLLDLSASFRNWCEGKSIDLDAPSIEKVFTTWCKSYSHR